MDQQYQYLSFCRIQCYYAFSMFSWNNQLKWFRAIFKLEGNITGQLVVSGRELFLKGLHVVVRGTIMMYFMLV